MPPVSNGGRRAARPRVLVSDIYHGHMRLGLIRDIALGEFSSLELARKLGLDRADIETFEATYMEDIVAVRAALAGRISEEVAGLWVAKKQNRIAELQSDIEDCNRAIAVMRDTPQGEGYDTGLGSRRHTNLARTKLNALVAVANELGPLEKRGDGDKDKNMIHYVIEADDTIQAGLT